MALANARSLSTWVPDNEDVYRLLGELLLDKRWYDDLPEVVDYFLSRNHHHGWLGEKISGGCRDPLLRSVVIDHLMNRAQDDPDDWKVREFLGSCYAIAGDDEKANDYFDQARKLQRDLIDPVTKENYIAILKILEAHETPAILVQYPMKDLKALQIMLQDDIDLGRFVFVDNEQIFQEAVGREGYNVFFLDRFGGNFGHCTPKGNELLASNVADKVQELLEER